MENPSKVRQPNLNNPLGKKGKGNSPYFKQKKKLRRDIFG